jgi:hypothetical protein
LDTYAFIDHARQLERELAEVNAKISTGIVNYCVCNNAASPVPDCKCVTCTVKRAKTDRDRWRKMAEELAIIVRMEFGQDNWRLDRFNAMQKETAS